MKKIEKISGYKYRLYPNHEQTHSITQLFGCVRYVYNWALSLRKQHYKETGKDINSYELSKLLTQHKKSPEYLWLNDVLRMPLRIALFHLDTAYKNFFEKRCNKPKFKKKQNNQSATITYQYFNIENGKLNISKIPGTLKIRWSKHWTPDATVKSLTISRDTAGRYFVSFLVSEKIAVIENIGDKIGIDIGLSHFLTTSNGEKIFNPRCFDKLLKKYRRLCRSFSRKKKGSKNHEKARLKTARIATRIADMRRDFQHKLSTRLIRENQAIGIESLSVENMLKNRHLSKHIADASWSTFLNMLTYKGQWYNCDIVTLPQFFPSTKTCSACGFVIEELPLSTRIWTCPKCHTNHDRDINAAINILKHTVGETEIYACRDSVRPHHSSKRQESMKQELSLQDIHATGSPCI